MTSTGIAFGESRLNFAIGGEELDEVGVVCESERRG
jgi:hypothetical protein